MIHLIAAIDRHGAIGSKGDMLFHLREDLKRFKALTMGHTVVMGRRTFDSLPGGALPGRRNIVLTSNAAWTAPGAERAGSLADALSMAAEDSDIFNIGGGAVYAEAMPLADVLDITHIDAEGADPDTYVPVIGPEWHPTSSHPAPTTPPATFTTYHRH